MKRPTSLAMIALALAGTFSACAEASGEVRGGTQEIDTTPPVYLGCDQTESIDAGAGTKWSELFSDLFGPTSAAKCANPSCHGSEAGAGFKSSTFACFDQKRCREGMFEYGLVDTDSDIAQPEKSALVRIVRHCDELGETRGTMPQQPRSYYFSKSSIARIQQWIRDGALDN